MQKFPPTSRFNNIPGITMSPSPSMENGRAVSLVGNKSWTKMNNHWDQNSLTTKHLITRVKIRRPQDYLNYWRYWKSTSLNTNLDRSVKRFCNTNHYWSEENPENIIYKKSSLQCIRMSKSHKRNCRECRKHRYWIAIGQAWLIKNTKIYNHTFSIPRGNLLHSFIVG